MLATTDLCNEFFKKNKNKKGQVSAPNTTIDSLNKGNNLPIKKEKKFDNKIRVHYQACIRYVIDPAILKMSLYLIFS